MPNEDKKNIVMDILMGIMGAFEISIHELKTYGCPNDDNL